MTKNNKYELILDMTEWVRIWNKIFNDQPELKSIVREASYSVGDASLRGLNLKKNSESEEVNV